jgi:hypothetical protein
MEQEYGLIGGNIFHGELTPGQMFHCRPARRVRRPAHPHRGLYQAGSATHGGGGVTGIPVAMSSGRCCATAVAGVAGAAVTCHDELVTEALVVPEDEPRGGWTTVRAIGLAAPLARRG